MYYISLLVGRAFASLHPPFTPAIHTLNSHPPLTPTIHTRHSQVRQLLEADTAGLLRVVNTGVHVFTPAIHTCHSHPQFPPTMHTRHSHPPFTPAIHRCALRGCCAWLTRAFASSHPPFTPTIHTHHSHPIHTHTSHPPLLSAGGGFFVWSFVVLSLSCRVLCWCGVVPFVVCVVLFLLCVCV